MLSQKVFINIMKIQLSVFQVKFEVFFGTDSFYEHYEGTTNRLSDKTLNPGSENNL